MLIKNTSQELMELVMIPLRSGLVPFVQGNPGVGKSSLWRAIAEMHNLAFIDIRLSTFEPAHLNGFLWLNDSKTKAQFKLLDLFPLEDTPLPINELTGKPYKGWLIHLDEFTQMLKSMEGATYQLVLDRVVGTKKLHSKAVMAASGNPVGSGMIAKSISTPMRTRLVHFHLENTWENFQHTAVKLKFHPVICAYLSANPQNLNNFVTCTDNVDGTYACERSWEMMSQMLHTITNTKLKNGQMEKISEKHIPLLCGTVGDAAGNGLFTFFQQYYSCPSISEIVQNPQLCNLPADSTQQYAATAFLVHNATVNNGDKVAIYLSRFREEFQLIFGRLLLTHNKTVFDKHFKHLLQLVAKYAL